MLAEDADKPFSDPNFIYELKYDGYRLLVVVEDGKCELAVSYTHLTLPTSDLV